jgi:Tfp pilus assembly protein PilE
MANCTECGGETRAGESFCRQCGARLDAAAASPGAATSVTENDLTLFVGKNTDKYLGAFHKFTSNGEDSFAATWHWPAFFFSFWWLLYRKMYVWMLVFLLLGCIPFAGLLAMIGFGISANYLYYKHAKKKIAALKVQTSSEADRAAAMARAGGVNNVAIVLVPLVLVAVVGILAAIAIPQFAQYRQKAADQQAKHEIQDACSRGTAIFARQPEKTQIEPDELLYEGLVRTPEVEMMLLDGRRDTFSISAKHKKGTREYFTDQQCSLRESRLGTGNAQKQDMVL